eukprot:gene5396-9209_t
MSSLDPNRKKKIDLKNKLNPVPSYLSTENKQRGDSPMPTSNEINQASKVDTKKTEKNIKEIKPDE